MPEYARRVNLRVTIDGHDATDYMAPSLLDFTYVCNAGGKADEVQITLHNRDGHWSGDWKPKKGMPVQAEILCTDWEEPGEDIALTCGSFKIDEITFSGPPDKVQIKAVSADLTGGLRDSQKTRAWENTSLQTVAEQIAGEYGLELFYSGDAHQFERQDQRHAGDLAFLNRLASQFGMSCKAHDGKLVLFDKEDAEGRQAMLTIPKTGGQYSPKSFSFRESSSGTGYDKAEAAYTDPKTGTTHKAVAIKKPVSEEMESGGTLEDRIERARKAMTLQNRAESPAQAAKMARAALHGKNSRERTASVEIMGCPRLVAGQTVALEGFGDFSATYFIKTATHKIGGAGGYTTSLELSKPCPTREAGASEEVCVAALAAKASSGGQDSDNDVSVLNKEADARARQGFEKLLASLPDVLGAVDTLILCLPEIFSAEAGRAKNDNNEEKEKGWELLNQAMIRWLGNKGIAKEDNREVLWVDWDWVLMEANAKTVYEEVRDNVLNEAAKSALGDTLGKLGYLKLTPTKFNFITNKPWLWETEYHQSRDVQNGILARALAKTGQAVALGNFNFYGLADGYVKPLENGRYRIHVTKAAITMLDRFDFEEEQPLGFWDCEEKKFMGWDIDPTVANLLLNIHFRSFREAFGNGADFYLAAKPRYIANFKGLVYDYPL